MNDPVTFVVGVARSGTTFVADLLNEEFDHGMGPEGSFLPEFAKRLHRYGDLSKRPNLERLAKDVSLCEMLEIARKEYPEEKQFDVTPELMLENISEPTYSGVVRAVFSCVAKFQQKSFLGSKYPLYWRHIDLLDELFPNSARYVWIVRDGRDVALSLMKQPWGENSAYACARQWVDSMQKMRKVQERMPSDRMLVIRYEDLLTSPVQTLTRLERMLQTGLDDGRLRNIADSITADPRAANFGKWRDEMTEDDLRRFEALGGEWLSQLGYALHHENPRSSRIERAWYLATEYTRRLRQTLVD